MPYDPYSGCYYQDPNGLPGYDEWKLRSPYDDYEDQPECEHEEYEVDWEGRATCNHCSEHWWLTAAQLEAYDRAQTEWHREYERMCRREASRFWRVVDWLSRGVWRLTQRRKAAPVDDEIPF